MTVPIRRALLSVSNKEGLVEFAQALHQRGVAMLSTGGTATLLETQRRAGHAGLQRTPAFPKSWTAASRRCIRRSTAACSAAATSTTPSCAQHGIEPIDLVVVNLYPFAATIAKPDCTYEDAIENIDIGGPAMVRAAAKNHDRVAVIVDPLDYAAVLDELARSDGAVSRGDAQASRREGVRAHGQLRLRRRELSARASTKARGEFPQSLALQFRKRMDLRYGENPHQTAAFYAVADAQGASIGTREAAAGQGRSRTTTSPTATPRSNACGSSPSRPASSSSTPIRAASRSRATRSRPTTARIKTDPTSAFGGIIAFNRALDGEHRARDRRAPVRRADHRAGGRRRRARALRAQGKRARAGDRTASRRATSVTSTAASTAACSCRRAIDGMVAQGRSQGRHEAPADAPPSSTTCCSRGRCASTSSRTPSCTRRSA